MALNKKHDPGLDALLLQAAVDVRRVNPHIGTAEQPLPDADYAEIEHGRQDAERLWDALESQAAAPRADGAAARAVDDDRGE